MGGILLIPHPSPAPNPVGVENQTRGLMGAPQNAHLGLAWQHPRVPWPWSTSLVQGGICPAGVRGRIRAGSVTLHPWPGSCSPLRELIGATGRERGSAPLGVRQECPGAPDLPQHPALGRDGGLEQSGALARPLRICQSLALIEGSLIGQAAARAVPPGAAQPMQRAESRSVAAGGAPHGGQGTQGTLWHGAGAARSHPLPRHHTCRNWWYWCRRPRCPHPGHCSPPGSPPPPPPPSVAAAAPQCRGVKLPGKLPPGPTTQVHGVKPLPRCAPQAPGELSHGCHPHTLPGAVAQNRAPPAAPQPWFPQCPTGTTPRANEHRANEARGGSRGC